MKLAIGMNALPVQRRQRRRQTVSIPKPVLRARGQEVAPVLALALAPALAPALCNQPVVEAAVEQQMW